MPIQFAAGQKKKQSHHFSASALRISRRREERSKEQRGGETVNIESNLDIGARALRDGGVDQREEGLDLGPAEGRRVGAEEGG